MVGSQTFVIPGFGVRLQGLWRRINALSAPDISFSDTFSYERQGQGAYIQHIEEIFLGVRKILLIQAFAANRCRL